MQTLFEDDFHLKKPNLDTCGESTTVVGRASDGNQLILVGEGNIVDIEYQQKIGSRPSVTFPSIDGVKLQKSNY